MYETLVCKNPQYARNLLLTWLAIDMVNTLSNTETRTALLNTLAQIPKGSVATYGQVAEYAGMPRAARSVGRLLRTLPKDTEIPWHRVVNACGKTSIPHQGALVQRERLEAEGVVFLNGKISLKDYQWRP